MTVFAQSTRLVIVHNLDLIGVAVVPDKADAPLFVDPDAVLTVAATRKSLKAITGRDSQVIQVRSVMEHHQLALRPALDMFREPANTPAFGNCLSIPITEALDHTLYAPYHCLNRPGSPASSVDHSTFRA